MENLILQNKESVNRIWTLLKIVMLILLLITLGFIFYSSITNIIINTAIQSMEELAVHEEHAIENNLRTRWDNLRSTGIYIRQKRHKTTKSLLLDLNMCRNLIECLRIFLIAEDGKVVNSNMQIDNKPEWIEEYHKRGKNFIFRNIPETLSSEGRAEILVSGVQIDPFTVEGSTYRYIVARMQISTIEEDLKVDTYGGKGYSSVIDSEGNYIVMAKRSYTAQNTDNFYKKLDAFTLLNMSIEEIKTKISNREHFSVEGIKKDGQKWIIALIPMKDVNWYFTMTAPRHVFEEQTISIIKIVAILMFFLLLGIFLIYGISLHRRARTIAIERQHRKELSEALTLAEQANRAKTVFLNNMSHDIRTPMNAIIGFTALVMNHLDNKERVKDYLNKITQSSNHLLSLINDVLDMSRIESGKMNIEEKEENLASILHSLSDIIQSNISAKQLELIIDTVDVFDECIFCDKLRLNQVLLNILSNSIKFTPPGGQISIRITEKEKISSDCACYEFRIKDTGIGMSQDFLKDIFEPFSRERTSTVSGIQGTGLGMSITKNIIDMMNGDIQVTSEQGKGTEFIVTLQFKLQTDRHPIDIIKNLENFRGLVVDDDMNTCQSIANMLRQIGMRSEWTMYGKEAIVRTEEAMHIGDPFHVYIIDWLMPDMNGIESARRIRKAVGEQAPIIILTAYDWSDIEAEAREAGVTAFASKPLFPSDLHRILAKTCCEIVEEEVYKEETPTINIRKWRILLVEDNELNREIAQEVLQEEGFIVESVDNGQKAVDALEQAQPGWFDLILMDIQMPIMNGYQATQKIRQLSNPKRAHVPIIAMTANAFEEDRQAALQAGMDAHVSKPINIPVLLATLKQLLSKTSS